MIRNRKIVIVGATSAIARACAQLWIARSNSDLVLIGRDGNRLKRVADDLRVRNPQSDIRVHVSNFLSPSEIQTTVDMVFAEGGIDIVLIAHGCLPDQNACQNDLRRCRESIEINAVSPVLFAEGFATRLDASGHGTLALIGSVAGDRGRKSNYVYGSAKGLIASYAQGLQHRFAGRQIKIVLIKPGPTDTAMTAHLKGTGTRLASLETVATRIVNGIDRGQAIIYAPARWRIIMWIIRQLPDFVFNKLNI